MRLWCGRPIREGRDIRCSSAALAQVLCLYQGEGGLRQAMESLPVALADIPVEDETVYMDADTPEEFENLLKIAAEREKNR